MTAKAESAESYVVMADQRRREELTRAQRCRGELELRIQALAGSVSQAEEPAGGRALERLRKLELEMHRAAVVDRDSAAATARKSQDDLHAHRKDLGRRSQ